MLQEKQIEDLYQMLGLTDKSEMIQESIYELPLESSSISYIRCDNVTCIPNQEEDSCPIGIIS
jgi:hypothetical protein